MSPILKKSFTLVTLFVFIFTLLGCASTTQPRGRATQATAPVYAKGNKRVETPRSDYQYNAMENINEDSEHQEKLALYAGLGTGVAVGVVGFFALLLASLPFMFAGHVPIG